MIENFGSWVGWKYVFDKNKAAALNSAEEAVQCPEYLWIKTAKKIMFQIRLLGRNFDADIYTRMLQAFLSINDGWGVLLPVSDRFIFV